MAPQGLKRHKKKRPADITGFGNQFHVMGRSTQTHPGHAERLPMSHMLPFSHQLNEAVSSLSSEMMSHLLLQQPGDDLTDSAGHRPMTLAMT